MTGEQEQEYLAYVSARTTWLRRVAYLLTHDWDSADELVQATITRLFVQWRRVRHADDVDAYVRRMLLNIWPCAGGGGSCGCGAPRSPRPPPAPPCWRW